MNQVSQDFQAPHETLQTLRRIVQQFGTPTYAFDVRRMRTQVEKLKKCLPDRVDVIYSLKANASLGICDVFRQFGIGADVASAGELATAKAAGFSAEQIFVAGPFKSAETLELLRETPHAEISVDSPSELRMLANAGLVNPLVLRLRPDFSSHAVVRAGSESRFGFTAKDLDLIRDDLLTSGLNCVGFHVFMGSQVLSAQSLGEHLRGALDLSMKSARILGITPTLLNLGGGFGIPYGPHDSELDLELVGHELSRLVDRASPARIVLELGRYLIAEAGWYLTSVLGHQTHQGRRAVVVDGGTHQRADMCGLCLRTRSYPPIALDAVRTRSAPTDVLGCLSLPEDVMTEASPLPELKAGDVLAFPNAGAYGVWSSPALFHGSPLPAEAAFDGSSIQALRERQPADSILLGQKHFVGEQAVANV